MNCEYYQQLIADKLPLSLRYTGSATDKWILDLTFLEQ